jgi:hypothetical protein
MAKDQLPGFWEMRRLLYSKNVAVEDIVAAADELARAERYSDALDLYEKAQNLEGVRSVAAKVFSDGDVGIWMKARRILKAPITVEEWGKLAEVALSAEKPHFALFAYKRAGNEPKVEELQRALSGDKGLVPPPKETP